MCVALAAVFSVSGVAKLLDRTGTREAVVGFGVPARLVPLTAGALAPAELLTALLLVLPATRALGLVVAAALLLAFTGAVALALRAGRRPDCHCFGRLGGADVSGRTVVRNVALLALVGLGGSGLAAGEVPDGRGTAGALVLGIIVAAAVVAAEAVAGAAARRRRASRDEAAYAVVSRVPAPRFTAATLGGTQTSLDELLAPGLPLLLVTLSPGCGPCRVLRPDVATWAQLFRERLTVAALATGTAEANRSSYADVPHLTVLLDEADVRTDLGISATPSAVVVGPDGMLASGVASGEALVRRLLVSTVTGVETAPDDVGDGPAEEGGDDISVDELDLAAVVGPRDGVQRHGLGESTVLMDPSTGATVALDQIGALIWSVLDGHSALAEIVADLADVYGVPADEIGPDVLSLAQSLGRAGLLAGVTPRRASSDVLDTHDPSGHDHAGRTSAGPAERPAADDEPVRTV